MSPRGSDCNTAQYNSDFLGLDNNLVGAGHKDFQLDVLLTPEMLFVKNNMMVMKQRNEMKANMPEKVKEKRV